MSFLFHKNHNVYFFHTLFIHCVYVCEYGRCTHVKASCWDPCGSQMGRRLSGSKYSYSLTFHTNKIRMRTSKKHCSSLQSGGPRLAPNWQSCSLHGTSPRIAGTCRHAQWEDLLKKKRRRGTGELDQR